MDEPLQALQGVGCVTNFMNMRLCPVYDVDNNNFPLLEDTVGDIDLRYGTVRLAGCLYGLLVVWGNKTKLPLSRVKRRKMPQKV